MAFFMFDSSALSAGDGFDAYRHLYSGGSNVSAHGDEFLARVEAHRLGKLVMFDRRLNDVAHERTARRANSDGFEHATLQLNLSGSLMVETPGGTVCARAGEIVFFDMTRPQRTLLKNCHYLTFSIAPSLLGAMRKRTADLHGTILKGANAFILADMMSSLVRKPIHDESAVAGRVAQMFRQALALALETDEEFRPRDSSEAMDRVKLLVEAHLSERELAPDWIARRANLSRTRLYDLFKPVGGISRYVQQARAERLRQLLAMSEATTRSIGALCHQVGFANESHANRTFSDVFGMSPGQYRKQMGERFAHGVVETTSDFDGWIRSLRAA